MAWSILTLYCPKKSLLKVQNYLVVVVAAAVVVVVVVESACKKNKSKRPWVGVDWE